MTRINDYMWHLPHTLEIDDPEDVAVLQQQFNQPLVDNLSEPLADLGYQLSSSDVHVPPDKIVTMSEMANTYKANVRFVKYMDDNIFTRIYFEHLEWALRLPEHENHTYLINLDRFKVQDRSTMIAVPNWEGRIFARMSSLEGDVLHAISNDSIWRYQSVDELLDQLDRFLQKFTTRGQQWVEST